MMKQGLEPREPSPLTCAYIPSLCHLPAGQEASHGILPVCVGCADTQQASRKRISVKPFHATSLKLSGWETHSVLGHKARCVPCGRGNKEQPHFSWEPIHVVIPMISSSRPDSAVPGSARTHGFSESPKNPGFHPNPTKFLIFGFASLYT